VRENQPVDALEVDDVSSETGLSIVSQLGSFRQSRSALAPLERVLPPEGGLRQWVLTVPFSSRRRLAQDGALLGRLTRIAVETVLAFYAARAGEKVGLGARTAASSPGEARPSLRTSEVGEVLERRRAGAKCAKHCTPTHFQSGGETQWLDPEVVLRALEQPCALYSAGVIEATCGGPVREGRASLW
jgi:hypothetical protein